MLRTARNISLLLVLCMLCMMNTAPEVRAETAAGALSGGLPNEMIIEYEGTNYRVKKRAEFALVICVERAEANEFDGYIGVLAVDDNEKSMSLLELDGRIALADDTGILRLSDAYLTGSDMQESSLAALDLLNQVLPYALIDHYIVFDMDGLSVLNEYPGYSDAEESEESEDGVKQKLRRAKAFVEGLPSKQLSKVFEQLSGYLKSDLKSGALMKIADKAEKYTIEPTVHLLQSVVCAEENEEKKEYLLPDADETKRIMMDLFFEADPYSNQ